MGLLALLLAAIPVADFFNPAARAFPLRSLETLGDKRPHEKLRSRGFDPERYFTPPKYDDSIPQAMSPRVRLYQGFTYSTRLAEKKRFWRIAAERQKLRALVPWVDKIALPSPADFIRQHRKLTEGIPANRDPNQALLALRHSERQFRTWWKQELAARIKNSRKQDQRWATMRLTSMVKRGNEDARDVLALLSDAKPPARRTGPEVDFYGLTTTDETVVFCIDVSTSMDFPMDGYGGKREARRTRTVRELSRTIEALKPGTKFNIVFFSARTRSLWREVQAVTDDTKAAALEAVKNAGTEGGTDVWSALAMAFRFKPGTVFLLTDGEPSSGRFLDPALIVHEAHARRGATRLHAVGLSRDQNTELLFNLAKASGGRFHADR